MKLALAQMQMSEDVHRNVERTMQCMEEAASNGAQLICFPEVQFYPFFPQFPNQEVSHYAYRMEDEVPQMLMKKAAKLGLVTVPNFYLQEDNLRYDASPVIDADGTLKGISKMVHVVQAHRVYEQDYYTPSDTGFHVYDTAAGKVGVVICYDRHFPESIRSCVLQDAQIILIPTAFWAGEPLDKYEWEMRTAAMQNNVFIAMCNRSGSEGELDFAGNSMVIDPNGEIIARAGIREELIYVDIEYGLIEHANQERHYLQLRRPEAYIN